LVVVALFAFGELTPDIHVGEKARRDYRARLNFSCEDRDNIDVASLLERHLQPNVYDEDMTALVQLEADVNRFLDAVSRAATVSAIPQPVSSAWPGIGEREFQVLKQDLTPSTRESVRQAIAEIFSDIKTTGVMDEIRRQQEDLEHSSLKDIVVRSRANGQERKIEWKETLIAEKDKMEDALRKRFRISFGDSRHGLMNVLVPALSGRIHPTLRYNERESVVMKNRAVRLASQQLAAGERYRKSIKEGDSILSLGEEATPAKIYELSMEHHLFEASRPLQSRLTLLAGLAVAAGLFNVLFFVFFLRLPGTSVERPARFLVLGGIAFVTIVLTEWFLVMGWSLYLVDRKSVV
jgi:hypothetical protein